MPHGAQADEGWEADKSPCMSAWEGINIVFPFASRRLGLRNRIEIANGGWSKDWNVHAFWASSTAPSIWETITNEDPFVWSSHCWSALEDTVSGAREAFPQTIHRKRPQHQNNRAHNTHTHTHTQNRNQQSCPSRVSTSSFRVTCTFRRISGVNRIDSYKFPD